MNIIFSVDVSSVIKWITEYNEYKLHFEENKKEYPQCFIV